MKQTQRRGWCGWCRRWRRGQSVGGPYLLCPKCGRPLTVAKPQQRAVAAAIAEESARYAVRCERTKHPHVGSYFALDKRSVERAARHAE